MDEQTGAGTQETRPAAPPADRPAVQPQQVGPTLAAPRSGRRRWGGLLGTGLALALAFLWGGLTYRELGPKTGHAAPVAGVAAAGGVVVAGSEAPPQWVGDFAKAFCDGDAKSLAARIGGQLAGQTDQIAQALAQRDWTCTDMTFLGGGTSPKGSFYVYVMRDKQSQQEWWVFTVQNDQVVGID